MIFLFLIHLFDLQDLDLDILFGSRSRHKQIEIQMLCSEEEERGIYQDPEKLEEVPNIWTNRLGKNLCLSNDYAKKMTWFNENIPMSISVFLFRRHHFLLFDQEAKVKGMDYSIASLINVVFVKL